MMGTIKAGFFQKLNVPNMIGCIDCTPVRIQAPPNHLHPEEYINRKQYFSINVQAISDIVVMDVDASWPGSVHGSRIFKNSDVYQKLITGAVNGILLGDNGYVITPFLLTSNTAAERNYNHIHKRTRCTIERTFGQVKRRFHCIGGTIRLKLERVPSVIAAALSSHNLAKRLGDPEFFLTNFIFFLDYCIFNPTDGSNL